MKNKLLLPYKYKKWGWIILIPSIMLGILMLAWSPDSFLSIHLKIPEFFYFGDIYWGLYTDILPTLIGILIIAGLLLVGFSQEKTEDEFIAKIRLDSLLWAVIINYSILVLAFLLVYGLKFIDVMMYNMFTVLLIFVLRFNYLIRFKYKTQPDD